MKALLHALGAPSAPGTPGTPNTKDTKDTKGTKDTPDLINEIYDIFRQYPAVFPDAYFRFLKANLEDSIKRNQYKYIDGVFLSWKQYKRATDLKANAPHSPVIAQPGDFLLDKMVSANPGRGEGHKMIERFLAIVGRNKCYLKVAADNDVAIRFYEGHGFRKIAQTDFGSVPGLLMLRSGR